MDIPRKVAPNSKHEKTQFMKNIEIFLISGKSLIVPKNTKGDALILQNDFSKAKTL